MLELYRNAFSNLSSNTWRLSFVILVNRAGTMVIPFLSVYMSAKLNFSLKDTGFILSSFGLGAVLGSFLGGQLSDRLGSIRTQFFSLLLTALFFVLLERVQTVNSMLVLIFFLAVVAESFRPANAAAISHFSTDETRTRAFALNRLAINLGMVIGPSLGGFLALENYSYLFWFDAATCFLAALFVFYFFGMKTTKNTGIIQKKEDDISKSSILKDKRFLVILSFTLPFALIFFQLFSSYPLFLKKELFLDESFIGLLFAINGLMIVALEMLISHKLEKKALLPFISLGTLLIAVSFFLLAFAEGKVVVIFSLIFLTLGEIITIPLLLSFVSSLAESGRTGAYMGYYSMTFSSAHILAPSVGMFLMAHYGSQNLWLFMATLGLFLAAYLYLAFSWKLKRI